MKIQIIGGKVYNVIGQNIAGWCQQMICFQKFVDNAWDPNAQQSFAFTPQANFPAHNLNLKVIGLNPDFLLKYFLLYIQLRLI